MTEFDGEIPRNIVGNANGDKLKVSASGYSMSEEEWRAANLPAEKLTLRWRYANKEIQLYERRLRSLHAYNVGPAVQAWVRSRLEWVRDNKLYEKPNGVIVLTIDPEGDVDIQLEELQKPYRGCEGTMWVATGSRLLAVCPSGELKNAADTFVRDLAGTLGYAVECVEAAPHPLDQAFIVSDEFGVVPIHGGDVVRKMQECFDKLWLLK